MIRILFASGVILGLSTVALAQTGEDHRAKSDLTNRAGSNGSTGATSRDARIGADLNVPQSGSLATPATAPQTAQQSPAMTSQAKKNVKKVQRAQKASSRADH